MAEVSLFLQFLLAIGLGAIIGLERERFAKQTKHYLFGGIRTYLFIALLGAITAYLANIYTHWIIFIVFIGIVSLLGLGYAKSIQFSKGKDIGLTGEIVALLTYFYGVMVLSDQALYAAILAITTTVFLYGKEKIHLFVNKLTKEEIYSALIFAIVAFVILPFLPDKTYGPYDVLNLHTIWLMVVFISGMGFVGYILVKLFGSNKGIGLTGLLGGLVSSTAVTMSFIGKSKKEKNKKLINLFVYATIIANIVMLVRVLIEVYVVNKTILGIVLLPIVAMGVVALLAAGILWLQQKQQKTTVQETTPVEHTSPLSLGPAIKFGLLFGLVLFVAKVAQLYFGQTGVYVASVVSGFVDVDAITLTMANLAGTSISAKTAATAITLAVMSNTLVKFGYAALLGSKPFRNKLGIIMGASVAAGIITLLVM